MQPSTIIAIDWSGRVDTAGQRRHIVAAREAIASWNMGTDPAAIRAIRRRIRALPPGQPLGEIEKFRDFYSASMFRDLVMHVREHRFSIPQIKEALRTLGLEFVSFSFTHPETGQKFRAMFPDPAAAADLDNWDRFERKYPDTFVAMYQFWARRPS